MEVTLCFLPLCFLVTLHLHTYRLLFVKCRQQHIVLSLRVHGGVVVQTQRILMSNIVDTGTTPFSAASHCVVEQLCFVKITLRWAVWLCCLLLVVPPYRESVAFMYSQGMSPNILYSVLGGSLCRVCFVLSFV